ncbi:MAG TPA: hypothetical protein VEV17_16810 [Bryobacteraceae bacterium]|nr:hypothetical protein [Bryobacteraceae bacterium]
MNLARSATACVVALVVPLLRADSLNCNLNDYKAAPGLTATVADDALTVMWDGEKQQELRLRLAIEVATPAIRELSVRRKGTPWATLASNVTPIFRIVSGRRRMSGQQLEPLHGLGGKITPELIDKDKWDAFWDAPLDVPGLPPGNRRPGGNLPPDLPRSPSEIHRASAQFHANSCQVKTNGARLEITFPGVQLGVFSGRLQFTVYKGTNLIRQEVIASTEEPSVAYKYDAGLRGMPIEAGTVIVWRDLAGHWQANEFGGNRNDNDVVLKTSNRLLVAERDRSGSIAVFPPPHTYFWAREIETNLGYNWYHKNNDASFSFGIRQAEREENPQYQGNFALYSAPPGTSQRMAVYFYASTESADATGASVLAFTHGDRFKPLPGYQVMAHHYHMDLGERLRQAGSLDAEIPDLEAIRDAGINIASEISSVFLGGNRARPEALDIIAASVEGARHHSDKNFVVMPDQEVYGSPLGGHTDLLFSHPVFWTERQAGQALVEDDPKHGKVYHVGTAADLMEMAHRENILINMPHPRTKGSTGYPDAVKDTEYFKDPQYQGVGFRWGMGLDLSEQRLCDHRCLALLDDMSNWQADLPAPPKYLLAITETRYKAPGDDVYAASPVNYVKLDALPSSTDMSAIIKALQRGDYFLTSGEVLIPTYTLEGAGGQRAVVADVEWTFPLEFVEVVWGDGQKTDRKIVSATGLAPFGKHRFRIPFDAAGQKWVRFAAWDSAGNGAIAQPIKLAAGH